MALDPALSRYHVGPAGYNDNLHYGVTDATPAERGMTGPTDCALRFLNGRLQGDVERQPWCCVASYYEPNEAMVVGREAYELYDVASLQLPPNLRDPMSDKPNMYRREQQIFANVSDDEWREAQACYLGRVTEIDAELGRLLALLRQHDALESTVVIVSFAALCGLSLRRPR